MSIDPNETEFVLSRYESELARDAGIAEAMAALPPQPVERTPTAAEDWLVPKMRKADSLRDRARVWAPGVVGTVVVGGLLLGPLEVPITGPIIAYGIAWTAFGWWTAAGRPGPRDTTVLLARLTVTVARALAVAAVAVAGWTRAAAIRVARLFRAVARRIRRLRVRRAGLAGA